MDQRTMERLSRSLASFGSRRRLLSRIGLGSSAAATIAASRVASPVTALAAGDVCEMAFLGTVRLGPTFDGPDADPIAPGALRGALTFTIGSGGSIGDAVLELESGIRLAGGGQLGGRTLGLRLVDDDDHLVVLEGIAEEMIRDCSGLIDGLMRGPVVGDLGDWSGVFSPPPSEGVCPGEGEIECNGECVDARTSPWQCGSCTTPCPSPGSCIDGVCHCASGYGTCLPGYVWREAVSGDTVCVEPWSRDQAAADNANASSRIDTTCDVGVDACRPGYVWREAVSGDHVCVLPAVRAQVATDNAAAAGRVDPGGAYGPDTCVAGYVWREAVAGDHVCVTTDVRTQAANDNANASARINPNCIYGPGSCLDGYLWREAAAGDTVCVEGWVRDQTAAENANAGDTVDPLCLT